MENIELKSGDILHCYRNTLLSRIICKFTKSKYSHSALVIENWGELFVAGSQYNGTKLRKLKDWKKKFNYTYEVSRPDEFTTEMKKKAVKKCGKTPYDFIGLIVYQPIFILTGIWLGNKRKNKKRMMCSVYVGYVFSMPKWWTDSPKAIQEYTQKSHKFTNIK